MKIVILKSCNCFPLKLCTEKILVLREKGILTQTAQIKRIFSELYYISFICMKEDALSPEKAFKSRTVFSLCLRAA